MFFDLFNILALLAIVGLTSATILQLIYQRWFRGPGMPPLARDWRVPGAAWLIVAILLLVGVYFLVILSKDPLQR